MKTTLKKNAVRCLFAITVLLLTSSCTNMSGSLANKKLIKDYYAAY